MWRSSGQGQGHRSRRRVCVNCSGCTFWMPWPKNYRHIFRASRSRSNIKVMGSRSRSYERKELHAFTCGLCSTERQSCHVVCMRRFRMTCYNVLLSLVGWYVYITVPLLFTWYTDERFLLFLLQILLTRGLYAGI